MGGNLIESLQQNYSEAENEIEGLGQNDTDEEQRAKIQYRERIERLRVMGKRIADFKRREK